MATSHHCGTHLIVLPRCLPSAQPNNATGVWPRNSFPCCRTEVYDLSPACSPKHCYRRNADYLAIAESPYTTLGRV